MTTAVADPSVLAVLQAMSDRLAAVETMNTQLQAQVLELERAIAALKTRPSAASAFSSPVQYVTVTVKREGNSLWYIADSKNPEIHHPIDGTQLRGRFVNLDIVPSTYEGETSNVAVLHIFNREANTIFRVRMGAKLEPKKAVPLKFFMEELGNVPDEALRSDIIFEVYPGTRKQQAVCVRLINPATGRSFTPPVGDISDEERELLRENAKSRWNDQSHQEELLQQSIARIQQFAQAPSEEMPTARKDVREKPKPQSPPTAKPSAVTAKQPQPNQEPPTAQSQQSQVQATQANPNLVKLTGLVMDLTEIETITKDDAPDRQCIKFTLAVGQTNHQCFAWDEVATRIGVLFPNFSTVNVSGIWRRRGSNYYFQVEDIESDNRPPQNLADLIAIAQVEVDRVGLTREQRDSLILHRYEKARHAMEENDLKDWILYLRGMGSPIGDA